MSQPGNDELPLYLQRKLARQCVRGCGAESADDSDECPAHRDESRARKRKSAAKRRAERRRKKKCIDCPKRSKTLRCRACERKNRGRTTGVDKRSIGVDNEAGKWKLAADTRPERAGQTTLRYVGHARRGRLSRAEQIEEDKRDARIAIGEIGKFIEELDDLKCPDVADMPVIQRDALRRKAGSFASYASRILDDLADKYR